MHCGKVFLGEKSPECLVPDALISPRASGGGAFGGAPSLCLWISELINFFSQVLLLLATQSIQTNTERKFLLHSGDQITYLSVGPSRLPLEVACLEKSEDSPCLSAARLLGTGCSHIHLATFTECLCVQQSPPNTM